MRFDQMPAELVLMVAAKSDLRTRGHMRETSKRFRKIYSSVDHVKLGNQIRIARSKVKDEWMTVEINQKSFEVKMKGFYAQKRLHKKIFSNVEAITELLFNNIDFGYRDFHGVLKIFPSLKKITNITFYQSYSGSFSERIFGKYFVTSIRVIGQELRNGLNFANDKFFAIYRDNFEFKASGTTVIDKTGIYNRISDDTLRELVEWPRKIFKLNNVICAFTIPVLFKAIEYMIRRNSEIDWDLGVLQMDDSETNILNGYIAGITEEYEHILIYSCKIQVQPELEVTEHIFASGNCRISFKTHKQLEEQFEQGMSLEDWWNQLKESAQMS